MKIFGPTSAVVTGLFLSAAYIALFYAPQDAREWRCSKLCREQQRWSSAASNVNGHDICACSKYPDTIIVMLPKAPKK